MVCICHRLVFLLLPLPSPGNHQPPSCPCGLIAFPWMFHTCRHAVCALSERLALSFIQQACLEVQARALTGPLSRWLMLHRVYPFSCWRTLDSPLSGGQEWAASCTPELVLVGTELSLPQSEHLAVGSVAQFNWTTKQCCPARLYRSKCPEHCVSSGGSTSLPTVMWFVL